MITDTKDQILTVEELQSYLKIPKPTIYALAQARRLPAAKIGKHWRFRKTDIDQWLEAQILSAPLPRRVRSKSKDHVHQ